MKRPLAFTAVTGICALAALAGLGGSARATYPGATNGRIAFGMNVNGNVDVFTARPGGQDLRRLTTEPGFDACAAYSADGRRIAYCSGQGGGPVQVWTMKQNGTDKQQVTHLSGPAIFPDFSPDGSEIVFTAQPAGSPTRDIYVIGSDGSGLTRLTSVGNNVYPAFSPDGSKIVFNSNRTGTSQVYVMNADGSGQTQLTFDSQPKDQVSDWSPDGSKIAYLADTHGISDVVNPSWGDIWVMNADGSGKHAITSGATYYGTAWSPDGTRIATLDFTANTRIVYTVNASDGSDPQAVHPGPGPQYVPGWQPRGTDLEAALVPAASARSGAHVKLSVLPLPKSSLGSAAQRLRLEHDSGVRPKWRLVGLPVTPNRSFIPGNADPGALDAIRISGYALDYGLGASGRAGVTEVWTSIDQYKTSADAKKGLSFWKREDRRVLWHKYTRGLAFAIKAEKVAPVGSGRFAFLVSYRAANIAPLFGLDEQFTRGRYEAEVTVWAGTAAAAEKLAPNLATKLEERIKLALAGRLHAKPVKLPRQETGPPPGGPHLSPLGLKPTDLGVQASRYRWDHGYGTRWDRSALSYYFDNLFTAQFDFSQEIGWFATVNQASFTADFEFALASFDGSSVDLSSVGDGAEGFLANRQNYADLVFSSGQLEEHVTFLKYSPISTSEVQKMAQTVADKINSAGLGS